MSFWPLINGSKRAWVLSNAFSYLVLSPPEAAFAFPWQDRAGSQHRCDVRQTISQAFFLHPPFLPSFSWVPGSTAPVRWRDEVGRAGTRVGRRVDKKAAVLFHLCLFLLPLIFPLLSASFFSGCPGFWFSRARAYIRPPSVWGWGFSQILWFNQHSAGW